MKKNALISLVLSIVLVVGLCPTAYAVESPVSAESSQAEETQTSNTQTEGVEAENHNGTTATPPAEATNESGAPAEETVATEEPEEAQEDNAGVALQSEDTIQPQALNATITAQAHVQSIGWQDKITTSSTNFIGTSAQSKRIEALSLKLNGVGGSIQYNLHVQKIGWQGWKSDGAIAGTTGQSLRVEALQVRLTGEAASLYDVYYRAHVQGFGWMEWACNGASAGTQASSLRAEALQVVLVPKNSGAPASYSPATAVPSRSFIEKPGISFRTHVQSIGWQGWRGNKATAGTTGQSLRVEALQAQLNSRNSSLSGGIEYSAHVQNIGWQNVVSNGAISGTTGESLRVEAITMNLTGEIAQYYNIFYRVHVQNYGWLGWACNGENAGTQGHGLRVEAVEVVVQASDFAAPGTTVRSFIPNTYIYLDAGHGWSGRDGYDCGATGCGYKEAEQTAELVNKVAWYAENKYGLNVYNNVNCGLRFSDRNQDAANRGCTSLVSFHFNATGTGRGTGSESYYSSAYGAPGSVTLRNIMHSKLTGSLGLTNRGLKDYGWTVTCGSVPATLLEVCFIDNAYDMSVYKSREDAVADALAAGLAEAASQGL